VDNDGQFFSSTPTVRSRSNSVSSRDSGSHKMNFTDDDTTPVEMQCPISHEIMKDPVLCADGHTYERSCIEEWMKHNITSPLTGKELTSTNLVPNHALRSLIQSIAPQTEE